MKSLLFVRFALALMLSSVSAFSLQRKTALGNNVGISLRNNPRTLYLATKLDDEVNTGTKSVEETVEKYGLEAGLFESLKLKEGGAETAKDLLKKYGIAYLATSIPLAIVSFAICYFLVDSGVDVAALLAKVGIQVNENSEKVGTAAIAYAAHKAASPIRFPPTVLLTPVVAKLIGKEPSEADEV